MPAPQVMPLNQAAWRLPACRAMTRSAPPISHRILAWMRPTPPAALMRFLRLGDAAGDAVGDQLLMPFPAGAFRL